MDVVTETLARTYLATPSDENAHRVANQVARRTSEGKVRKVLVSARSGGGWSTGIYMDDVATRNAIADLMAEHAGLIAAVEALGEGEELSYSNPAIVDLRKAVKAAMGEYDGIPSVLVQNYGSDAVPALDVVEVTGPYCIAEYDGSEWVQTPETFRWR